MDLKLITPSSFHINNLGDGVTAELLWTAVDISLIKAFIIEYFDIYTKQWKAYDGYRGACEPTAKAVQSLRVEMDVIGQYGFRIRGMGTDASMSEWVVASVDISLIQSQVAETDRYYVVSGLQVSPDAGLALIVGYGSAMMGGTQRVVSSDVTLTLSAPNEEYIVYISGLGVVGFTTSATTPIDSIRLANVVVDPQSVVTITDTRFLWAPGDVSATWTIGDGASIANVVRWTTYHELNLCGWKVYRGSEDDNLEFIANVAETSSSYTDNNFIVQGTAYYYAVAAYDWGEHISPQSTPIMIESGDVTAPAVPTGLSVIVDTTDGLFIPKASWSENTEDDLDYYILWLGYSVDDVAMGMTKHQNVPKTEHTNVLISNLQQGQTCFVALSAIDHHGNESAYCTPVQVKLYDLTIPKAPTWRTPAYSTTGGIGLYNGTVTLNFYAVVQNVGNSVATDIISYRIYTLSQGVYTLADAVEQTSSDDISRTLTGIYGGSAIVYVLTAMDTSGNESAYSTTQSVSVGDTTIPKAPTSCSFTLYYPPTVDTDRVKIEWAAVVQNVGDTSCTDLAGYRVYKGYTSWDRMLVATVDDAILEWTDLDVIRAHDYWYCVRALDSHGNESAESNVVTMTVGNFTPCAVPEWDATPITTSYSFSTGKATNVLHFSGDNETTLSHYVIEATYEGVYIPIGRVNKTVSTTYTFTHGDLDYGTSMSYRMCSEDHDENRSLYTITETIVSGTGAVLSQPVVTATPEYSLSPLRSDIEVSWVAISNALEYIVERSVNGTFYSYLTTTAALLIHDTGLTNGKTYWYRVKAMNALIDSGFGTAASAAAGYSAVPSTPSPVPTITLGASIDADHSITLTWDACVDTSSIDHYNIYRRHPVTNTEWIKISETTALTYIDSAREYNVTYYYRVSAVNAFGLESLMGACNTTCVDSSTPTHIEAPTGLVEPLGGQYKVTLTWTYSAPTDFESYGVWRKIESGGTLVLISTINDSSTKTFSESGLKAGVNYLYYITCMDTYRNSSATTDYLTVTPSDTTIPGTPGTITATGVLGGVHISFAAVTVNNESPTPTTMTDFDMYVLAAGNTVGFTANASTSILQSKLPTFIHPTGYDGLTWYYKVKVVDLYGNSGAWSAVSSGATATQFSTAPTDPTSVTATAGIDNLADGTRNYHLHVSWTHTPDALFSIYNIYNGTTLLEQRKASPCILNNLMPGDYTISVSAQDKFGNESAHVATNPVTTELLNVPVSISGPATSKIIIGVRIFGISWEDVKTRGTAPIVNLDYYELQYASHTDIGYTYITGDWLPLFSGKVTYFVHGGNDARLDYNKYHVYRIRCVDTFGNQSSWVRITDDNKKPSQTGTDDLALNVVMAQHIYAGEVQTIHISSEGLDARNGRIIHITSASIDAGEINANHLNLTLGGHNYIKNSAFGMKNLAGELGLNWTLTNTTVDTQGDLPLSNISTCAKFLKPLAGDPTRSISQSISVTELKGFPCILSLYAKGVALSGRTPYADVTVVSPTLGSITHSLGITTGTTEWQRYSDSFTIPVDASSIVLNINMSGNGIGTAYISGIQLEIADVISPWNPSPNELYGVSGGVQMNSAGLIITGGNIKIQDSDGLGGTSTLTSLGLTTTKTGGAASLTSSGLVVSGGAIDISSETAGGRFYINGDGIYAYTKVGQNWVSRMEILSADGSVSLVDGSVTMNGTGGNVLTLDSSGLTATYGGNDVFTLDSTTGVVSLIGSFNVSTGVGAGSYIKLDGPNNLLEMRNAAEEQVLRVDGQAGTVVLAGEDVTIRTSSADSGSRVTFNSTGLKGYDGATLGWHLRSDGSALFTNSVVITSPTSGASQILIDVTPDAGDQAGLSGSGWYLQERGASFTNASIGNGSIIMDSTGMIIKDPDVATFAGITIKDTLDNEMTTIDSRGIRLLADGAISLDTGGSIVFASGGTAIDASGINAEKIRGSQVIVRNDSTGVGSISVQSAGGVEKVLLNNSGITITDGALNVTAPGGAVLISNGVVNAQALNIGAGGGNWLLNGRADFEFDDTTFEAISQWHKIGSPTITRDTVAAVSGEYSFKIIAPTQNSGMRQSALWAYTSETQSSNTIAYTLSCWVKALSGRWRVSIVDGVTETGTTPVQSSDIVAADGLKYITLRFKALQSPMAYVTITCIGDITGTATCHVTDLMVVMGNAAPGYSPHTTEVFTQNVQITKAGIKVTGGKIDITTSDDTLTINDTGITYTGDGGEFKLIDAGFSMDFGALSGKVTIDKDNGITSLLGTNSVTINDGKITIRGNGGIDILGNAGPQQLSMSGSEIKLTNTKDIGGNAITYTKLTPGLGLEIVGSGLVSMKSSYLTNVSRMYISSDSLKIYKSTQADNAPAITIGIVSNTPTISIDDGTFLLRATTTGAGGTQKVRIDNAGILLSNGAAFSLVSNTGNVNISNTGISITDGTFLLGNASSTTKSVFMDSDNILIQHKADGASQFTWKTQIDAAGIRTTRDGVIFNPFLAGLEMLGPYTVTGGDITVTLPNSRYSSSCKLFPVITQLPTYNHSEYNRSQGYSLNIIPTYTINRLSSFRIQGSLYSPTNRTEMTLVEASGYVDEVPANQYLVSYGTSGTPLDSDVKSHWYGFNTFADTVRSAVLNFNIKTRGSGVSWGRCVLNVEVQVRTRKTVNGNTTDSGWLPHYLQQFSATDPWYTNGTNLIIPWDLSTGNPNYATGVEVHFRFRAWGNNASYLLSYTENGVYCKDPTLSYRTGGQVNMPDEIKCYVLLIDTSC